MKRIIFFFCFFVTGLLLAQKNIFLSNDYWKTKPTVEQVKQKITEGNNPTELNERAYDAVSLAINNGAPYETILFLLSLEGNEVDKLTHDKRTYLFWAAFQNNLPLINYLLQKGADVNVKDSHMYTPLLFAAVRGNINTELYDILINKGANINEKNENGANALLLAIPHMKDLKEAQYFIKKGLSLKSIDNNGDDALFYASRNGNQKIINQLIKKGFNPKTLNNKGQNLMFAAAEGSRMKTNDLEFFKYIESLGVSSNQKDKEGLTPLFTLSSRHKDITVLNYFLDKGNSVNQLDKEGNTPLINASSRNSLEVVSLLENKSSNINATNNQGHSALTLAVARNTSDVVSYLIKKGADINVKDTKGNTLVYYLLDSYTPREVKKFDEKWNILAEKGLNFAQNQEKGNNIYHLAVDKADLNLLQKVASVNVDINVKNQDGFTPLHKAAMTAKNLDIIKFLLEKGAKKTITTDFEETAYDLAKENEALKDKDINFLK
ncbi:ankyrin repeat domain-containing protein [Capnocytophaga cynodegmi]|uniref:ankyrin repeat domain-containing protein n=1 Tax=Capnocytophaga cynodegmi TaxID=28189 RepID=UPI0021007EF3|nr:ankyrin repeat domain-containing protein [Capnocytophaga cynodegmi]